jgi:hypothetical protein
MSLTYTLVRECLNNWTTMQAAGKLKEAEYYNGNDMWQITPASRG